MAYKGITLCLFHSNIEGSLGKFCDTKCSLVKQGGKIFLRVCLHFACLFTF